MLAYLTIDINKILLKTKHYATITLYRHATGYSKFRHHSKEKYVVPHRWQRVFFTGVFTTFILIIYRSTQAFSSNDILLNLTSTERIEYRMDDKFKPLDLKTLPIIEINNSGNNKIKSYENRLRRFSEPDKIFRYFATIKATSDCSRTNEIFMTPFDFYRAIMYDEVQPKKFTLDSFRKLNLDKTDWKEYADEAFPPDSIFYQIPPFNGLLSYEDFLFLLVIISVPQKRLHYVFQMLDEDNNQILSRKEFGQLRKILLTQYNYLNQHNLSNSGIEELLFRNGNQIDQNEFTSFFRRIRDDIYRVEFYENRSDAISKHQFVSHLLRYGVG